MNRYCVEKWQNHKHLLEQALNEYPDLESLDYESLMNLCVKHILNTGLDKYDDRFYKPNVVVAYGGQYSGEVLFVIVPENGFSGFLVSYTEYGSCAFCDTLEHIIWEFIYEKKITREEAIKDLMSVCKDMVCNIVKPYNQGFSYDARFDTIEVKL